MKKYKVSKEEIFVGWSKRLGPASFSERQIMDYAAVVDPLPLHTDLEHAKKSMFGGLISSGGQPYAHFHSTYFTPTFGYSVVAGMGINNWRFVQPVFPEQEIFCRIEILETKERNFGLKIVWFFEFLDSTGKRFSSLEASILHNYNLID